MSPLISALVKKLHAEDWQLRLEGVKTIGAMGGKGADALPHVAKLIGDTASDVRKAVAKVVLSMGIDDRCLEGIAEALQSDDWQTRQFA